MWVTKSLPLEGKTKKALQILKFAARTENQKSYKHSANPYYTLIRGHKLAIRQGNGGKKGGARKSENLGLKAVCLRTHLVHFPTVLAGTFS